MGRFAREAPSCFETGPSDAPLHEGLGSVQLLEQALELRAGQFGIPWENLGVNGIAELSQGNFVKRRVTNQCQPVDEAAVD